MAHNLLARQSACAPGTTACMSGTGEYCASLYSDVDSCGGCGHTCPRDSNGALSFCVNGACVSSPSTTSSSLVISTTYASSFSTSTKSYPTSSSTSPTSSIAPPSSSISSGAAAGIGIGCTLLGALLAGLVFFILSRRKRRQASLQQPYSPPNGGERGPVELTGRGITNEQPIVAELGGGHSIRQKTISKIKGWPSIRDRYTPAEVGPHDAVHVPDN